MSLGTPIWDEGGGESSASDSIPAGVFDVVVVGGGFAGLSAAYHALERFPGLRVAVLEAGRIGSGASGRNSGMVGPGVGQSLAALQQRVGSNAARDLYQATLSAVQTTVALVRREGIACDLLESGQLLVAQSRGERQRLRRQAELMTALGLPHAELDDEALRSRIQLPRAGGSESDGPSALRFSNAALVHPGKLAAGLASCVRARGGEIHEGWRAEPLRAQGSARGPLTIEVSNEAGSRIRLTTRKLVVATGGYTPTLGLFRGRVLPIQLQALATSPLPAETLEHLGWAGREGIVGASRIFNYFRLTADHRLVFGGGAPRYAWQGREASRSATRSLTWLEDELRRTFDGVPGSHHVAVTHAWTGVIDYVLDGLPAIGAQRSDPRMLHLLGWCGHGLALSVAAGAWIAEKIDTAKCAGAAWFRDRPPLLPTESLRWLGCRVAASAMQLMDRLDARP
jgi:gamma-glutamylputrescine oxidase